MKVSELFESKSSEVIKVHDSLSEAKKDTGDWYVLDVKAREILVSDVSKAEAKKKAAELGKTAWRLEDGSFLNDAGDVRYDSTRGWLDLSESLNEGF